MKFSDMDVRFAPKLWHTIILAQFATLFTTASYLAVLLRFEMKTALFIYFVASSIGIVVYGWRATREQQPSEADDLGNGFPEPGP